VHRHRHRHRHRWLGSLAAVLLAACALSACATVDRDDLSGYVDQLHSDAAEAALLAGQEAAGRIPYIFVWLHSAELSHHVQELRDHLDGEVSTNGVTQDVARAKLLSQRVGDSLGELHHRANDRAAASAVEASLTRQADQVESLYEKLQ
jgi:hypothetical protein